MAGPKYCRDIISVQMEVIVQHLVSLMSRFQSKAMCF